MKYGNVIYFRHLNTIGGIETWFYNLSCLFKDLDITFIINEGSYPQIQRVAKNTRLLIWNGKDRIECERLFVNFNLEILNYVKADRIYCVLHGDYLDMVNRNQLVRENLPIDPRINEYIGISKQVCDSWLELTGIKATLCYNPVLPPKPHRTIRICSAQRMSKEKGRDRMVLLARTLDYVCSHTGDKWMWDIYTDNTNAIYNENISYKQPRLDVSEYLNGYDWFVALSDNEGYCYSVVEALTRGVPCVVTEVPVFKEIGLDDTNSLTLKFNMENATEVVMKMFNSNLKFNYEPPKDSWRSFFLDIPSTYEYKEEQIMLHKVVALNTYQRLKVKDGKLDKILPEGFPFEVDDERLKVLLGDNPYKIPFVKVMETEEPIDQIEKVEEPIEEPKPKKRGRKKKEG